MCLSTGTNNNGQIHHRSPGDVHPQATRLSIKEPPGPTNRLASHVRPSMWKWQGYESARAALKGPKVENQPPELWPVCRTTAAPVVDFPHQLRSTPGQR